MTGLILIIIICLLAMLVCMKIGIEYVVQDLVIRNRISTSEAEEMISWSITRGTKIFFFLTTIPVNGLSLYITGK